MEFGEMVGRGSMGAVYRGWQIGLGRRPVAIKVLPSHLGGDVHLRERFQVEAATVARIASPHVVSMYTGGIQHGTLYFVMEFVEGEDLATRLERFQGKIDLKAALEFARQAAIGLASAHHLSIIHRDIKPANMMVAKDGTLKLTDFGLARLAAGTQGLTISGTVMGTVSYFSPEQARGERCEASTDVYALGVSLYEMIAGCLPFSGENPQALIYQHLNVVPAPLRSHNPEIPEDVQAVVFKCLQKLPSQRYTSAALVEDLTRLLAGKTPNLPSAELRQLRKGQMLGTQAQGGGISPVVLAVAGVALIAGTAGVVWGLTRAPASTQAPVASQPVETAKPAVPAVDPAAIDAAIAGGRFDEARALVAKGRAASPQDPLWDVRDRMINSTEAAAKQKVLDDQRARENAARIEQERIQAEAAAKAKADEEARVAAAAKAAEDARIARERAEHEAKEKAEAEARARAEEEARLARERAENEAKAKAAEAIARAKADEEARLARERAENEIKAKAEAANRAAAEMARIKAEAEAKARADEEVRIAREKAEAETRAKAEAEAKAKADELARLAREQAAAEALKSRTPTPSPTPASPASTVPAGSLPSVAAATIPEMIASIDGLVRSNGDGKNIGSLVSDSAYAAKLAKLATFPGVVFDSTLGEVQQNGDSATAAVSISHSLAAYPKRTLNYRYDLTRRDGRWVITTATRLP